MTAPQQQQGGNQDQRNDDGHSGFPVVPVVPASMVAYLAYRSHQFSFDQDMLASDLAAKLYPLWHIQQFNDLDRSTPLWLSSALPQVKTAYLQSQRLTAVYANDVRHAVLPDEPPLPMAVPDVELPDNVIPLHFDTTLIPHVGTPEQPLVEFSEFPAGDVATSLAITGNYNVKAQMPGVPEELMVNGLTNSTGAAVRQAMNGGRNASGQLVKMDRKIIGYARITDANPCWFCALLASRGAVYLKDSFAEGGQRNRWDGVLTKSDAHFQAPKDDMDLPPGYSNVAKVHDHCRCQLRPVYSKADFRDAEAKFYYSQWEQVRKDNYWMRNHKQLEIFRDQYVPFERKPADIKDIRDELKDRLARLALAGHGPHSTQMEWTNRQLSQLA